MDTFSNRNRLTENERRILTHLADNGPSTKRELSQALNIGWSTTVKMVSRLEQYTYIRFMGRPDRKNVQGVNSAVYGINPKAPTVGRAHV